MPQTRSSNPPKPNTYTFITVYYKHGEYSYREFPSLRAGLDYFARNHCESLNPPEDPTELLDMDDATLMHQVLALGTRMIRDQIRPGLVGIIEDDPNKGEAQEKIYLEMYYKHGEWNLSEGGSSYLDEIMDELDEDEYDDEEDMEEEALRLSQKRIENQEGWGVQEWWYGTLIGEAEQY